jgi:hypothetical protein
VRLLRISVTAIVGIHPRGHLACNGKYDHSSFTAGERHDAFFPDWTVGRRNTCLQFTRRRLET